MALPARRLTPRQADIVDRITRPGASRRLVAHELGVSEQAIQKHLSAAYRDFGVDTLAQLVRVLLGRRG